MTARLRPVLGPILVACIACLAGCDSCDAHQPYCGVSAECVEECGEIPFLACGSCPDGAMPAEDCADAGH